MTDTSSLSHLIERLERCAGPDRELDAAISLAVGTYRISQNGKSIWDMRADAGGQFVIGRAKPDQSERYSPEEAARLLSTTIGLPRYTSSIDAAMTLVPEGGSVVLNCFDVCTSPRVQKAHAHVSSIKVNGEWHPGCLGDAATPALALCIAALKARSLPAD